VGVGARLRGPADALAVLTQVKHDSLVTTYGLVHGAWHGAWCWEHVGEELRRRGHDVISVDLPIDDPAATFSTYADVIVSALAESQPAPVLVPHSMAGLSAPIAAARLSVRAMIFVCGLIATPGRSLIEQFIDQPEMLAAGYDEGIAQDDQGRSSWVDFESAARTLYADCGVASARRAFDRLRPQGQAAYAEPCPLSELPDVERAYVIGAQDRLVSPEWSREAAKHRLGVSPIELTGSHSPFLAQPEALVDVLARFG
jgi:pimeloyl-ACP methyl ester carboxylesterase